MDVKDRIIFKSSYIAPEHSSIKCSQFIINRFLHRYSIQKPCVGVCCTYPLNTPNTRLRTKKDPKMTRLTKQTQGSSKPMASFIYPKKIKNYTGQHQPFILHIHSFIHLQLAIYPGLGHSGFKTYPRNTRHKARIHLGWDVFHTYTHTYTPGVILEQSNLLTPNAFIGDRETATGDHSFPM